MTKEVIISIEGTQIGSEEDPIVVTASGIYHFTNGKHFVQYDEKLEGSDKSSKNTIKISPSNVVLTKKTVVQSHMEFELNELTRTYYQTAYGEMIFDIITKSISLEEKPYKIEARLEYTLTTQGSVVSDNIITVIITPSRLYIRPHQM